jgi:hypothetical protein
MRNGMRDYLPRLSCEYSILVSGESNLPTAGRARVAGRAGGRAVVFD